MKPIRTALYAVCVATTIGGVALASAATQPATPHDAPDSDTMRHGMHDGHGGPGGPEGSFHRVLDQLDLTADQKTQIHAIIDGARPQMQAAHESGRASRDQLEVTPPTDPAYAGMLASAKSNAVAQIQLMSDLWTQVYAKLTPDQRARIPGIVAAERAERDARQASWQQQRKGP
jgi:Spy/CpxP family protein refolding chaperone